MVFSYDTVNYALIWKYPTSIFTFHIDENGVPIVDTWSCIEYPEAPDPIITVSEYEMAIPIAMQTFDSNRLLGVLNTLLSQESILKLAPHTANLLGYCTWKNFWGEKSAASYIVLLETNLIASLQEIDVIKQAFMEQSIDLDRPFPGVTK